ncbi:MAG: ABC transporter permease [Acidilobaceae archaeon]
MITLNHRVIVAPIIETILSLILGFTISIIVLESLDYDSIRSIQLMLIHGFRDISYLLSISSPLILSALAFLVPLRAGLFNIGSEGQVYAGALLFLYISQYNGILAILLGAISGAIIGGLIGFIRAYRGVNEVISSIMLNWTLFYMVMFIVTRYLSDPIYTHQSIRAGLILGFIELLLLAITSTIVIHIILYSTTLGYEIRLLGSSIRAAKYSGVNVDSTIFKSMAIGGMLAGLAGALRVSNTGFIDITMSALFGLGFTGIGVALIGRAHPLAVIPSALLVSGLTIGGHRVELRLGTPPELADVIVGIIILALSIPYAFSILQVKLRGGRL